MMPTLALTNVTLFLRLCEELKLQLSPTFDGPYPNVALMFEKSRDRVMLSFPYLHGDTRQFATFLLDDTDTIDGVEAFVRETVARLREAPAPVDAKAGG